METRDDYGPCDVRMREFADTPHGWAGEGTLSYSTPTGKSVVWLLQACQKAGIKRPSLTMSDTGAISVHWKKAGLWLVVLVAGQGFAASAIDGNYMTRYTNGWAIKDSALGLPQSFKEFLLENFKFNGEENGVDCQP